MGTYYTESVFKQGQPIQINYSNQPTVRANSNERMVAMLDNGIRKIYPDVTRPEEFDHFYGNYAKGYWLEMRVRIVPVEALPIKDRWEYHPIEESVTAPPVVQHIDLVLVALSKLAHKESIEKGSDN